MSTLLPATTESLRFRSAGGPRRAGSCERDVYMSLTPDISGIAAVITAGWWAWTLTTLPTLRGWATTAIGGGIWGHSGVASDGTNMFVITGNTFNTGGNWMGGEAIIRLQAGPVFNGQPSTVNYWAPTNWFKLDQGDTDLGGVSAMLIDVPGATPSQLVLAIGKDSNAYLLDRNNLGGIAAPVAQLSVDGVIRASHLQLTARRRGTYFVFRR